MQRASSARRRGRPPLPDAALVAEIRALIMDLPTYGYRRVHALLRRQAELDGREATNPKRVYRVMKVHGLLLQRYGSRREAMGYVATTGRITAGCSRPHGRHCRASLRSGKPLAACHQMADR
jgi:putative transposase